MGWRRPVMMKVWHQCRWRQMNLRVTGSYKLWVNIWRNGNVLWLWWWMVVWN